MLLDFIVDLDSKGIKHCESAFSAITRTISFRLYNHFWNISHNGDYFKLECIGAARLETKDIESLWRFINSYNQ